MSLFSAAERFAALDHSSVKFDTERCLHSRDRFAECEACARLCPVDAIRPGKPPVLEAEKCVHCLACLPACPTGSYQARDFLTALLNAITRAEGRRVELICSQNPNPDRAFSPQAAGMRVPDCLAGIGVGGLAALAALDLEAVILRLDACHACPWGSLRSTIEARVALARTLLAPWQKEGIFQCVDEAGATPEAAPVDINNPPLTRRDLFRLAARQGQVAVARAMELESAQGPDQPGHDRLRLLGALRHLPERSPGAGPILDQGHFALVSVSAACTACGACARACPTSALEFTLNEAAQTFQLAFTPSLCIGCEVCIHVCEPDAVTVRHDPPFPAVFDAPTAATLVQGAFARCDRCKTVYRASPETDLCPLCEYRRRNPFGSRLPPGFKKAVNPHPKEVHS